MKPYSLLPHDMCVRSILYPARLSDPSSYNRRTPRKDAPLDVGVFRVPARNFLPLLAGFAISGGIAFSHSLRKLLLLCEMGARLSLSDSGRLNVRFPDRTGARSYREFPSPTPPHHGQC